MTSATPLEVRTGSQVLLTPKELALRWRMSTRTLDRWRAEQYGPAWMVLGGRVLYAIGDIEAYEARHRHPGP